MHSDDASAIYYGGSLLVRPTQPLRLSDLFDYEDYEMFGLTYDDDYRAWRYSRDNYGSFGSSYGGGLQAFGTDTFDNDYD